MKIINGKHHQLKNLFKNFRMAKPFPHIVLDDFFDKSYFKLLENYFSKEINGKNGGKDFSSQAEKNKWISLNSELPLQVTKIIQCLNSSFWVENLVKLTGLESIITTDIGNTKLANYHEMRSGGVLVSHVDHSYEPETEMPHILNIIIYISPEWETSHGGATLFYDRYGKKIIQKIDYVPNRAVIFLHTPYSFHGVESLSARTELIRRSIYIDYYSDSYNPFDGFNLEFPNHWFRHGTTFKLKRTRDYLRLSHINYTKALLRYSLNKFFQGEVFVTDK